MRLVITTTAVAGRQLCAVAPVCYVVADALLHGRKTQASATALRADATISRAPQRALLPQGAALRGIALLSHHALFL